MRIIGGSQIRQRLQRQPEAERRISRRQEQFAAPRAPHFAQPSGFCLRAPALQRQHVTRRPAEMGIEQGQIEQVENARALGRIVDLRIAGIDVVGNETLLEHPVGRVLVSGLHVVRRDSQACGNPLGEAFCIVARRLPGVGLAGDQAVVAPDRHAIAAPIQRKRPARQRLAGIPFALAVMQEAARRETIAQAPDQLVGVAAFLRPERRGVPLRRLIIVDRNESRLAAHGQPHVVRGKIGIDFFAERIEREPCLVGERRGHARPLGEPLDAHVVGERDLRRLDHAGDRRRGTVVRRRRERNVALAAQQSGRGVEADPAGAGDIHFGPGVQVGEIEIGAGGSVERFQVRPQLNEIAGDEARRQSDVPEDLHQEPRRIAARAGAGGERLLRRLHARLHAHDVADHVRQALIELDQKVDGVARLARNRLHQFFQARARRLRIDEGRQVLAQVGWRI